MQQNDFRDLQKDVINKIFGKTPEIPKEIVQESVEQSFRAMTDEQKIMSLSEDEVKLLLDFRKWSRSSGSASGVFHWRKQYGK